MGSDVTSAIVTVALGLISVATVATIFSDRAQASKVISAATGGFATDLLAAVSPVTGNAPQISSQY